MTLFYYVLSFVISNPDHFSLCVMLLFPLCGFKLFVSFFGFHHINISKFRYGFLVFALLGVCWPFRSCGLMPFISCGPVSSQPLSVEYYFSICFLLLQDNTVSYIKLFGISQHSNDLSLSLILLSLCVSVYMTSPELFPRLLTLLLTSHLLFRYSGELFISDSFFNF